MAGAGPRRAGPSSGTGPRGRTASEPYCRVGGTATRLPAARVHTRRPHTRGARSRWRRVVSLAEPQIRALVSRVPMASETLAGRTIAGYRLIERVGEGGTADVYRAEHPERGACAFKVLRSRLASDPTAVNRFLPEAGYGPRGHAPRGPADADGLLRGHAAVRGAGSAVGGAGGRARGHLQPRHDHLLPPHRSAPVLGAQPAGAVPAAPHPASQAAHPSRPRPQVPCRPRSRGDTRPRPLSGRAPADGPGVCHRRPGGGGGAAAARTPRPPRRAQTGRRP